MTAIGPNWHSPVAVLIERNMLICVTTSPMPNPAAELLEVALLLPDAERAAIAFQLIETLPPPSGQIALNDPDFLEELDRRFADPRGAIPWSELRDEE
jgi:hypothetical protein